MARPYGETLRTITPNCPDDVARLPPLDFVHITLLGPYVSAVPTRGVLRHFFRRETDETLINHR